MTPTRRSGTLRSGVAPEDDGWEMGGGEASAGIADGADFTISDFGFAICDCDEIAAEKPIFKGDCAAGEKICSGTVGVGFSFSGKFGNAEVSGATDLVCGDVSPLSKAPTCRRTPQFSESAEIARHFYAESDLAGAVRHAENARRLLAIPELRDDVAFCSQRDVFPLIAEMGADGSIRVCQS